MTNAVITLTNRLPTDTGFALRQDDGSFSQVFVPSHIVRGAAMQIGHTYDVVLTENSEALREITPWRVCQMDVGPAAAQQPAPEKAAPQTAAVLIDDQIMALLEASIYMTTGEIATALDASSAIVRDRLLAMFNRGEIVRADVHSRPNLQRASMCLWAVDVESFMLDGDCA